MSLSEILTELRQIRTLLEKQLPKNNYVPFAEIILTLPGHLQKTMIALAKQKDYVCASTISLSTHRKRAVESSYLNQLVTLGYVTKTRQGRTVVFKIKNDINTHNIE